MGATPKPLLTVVYGLLYNVTGDWRAISLATTGAFAVGVLLAACLVQRLAGLPAAVFVAIGLTGLSLLQSDLDPVDATPWAMVGWFGAGLLVARPRPRFGLAGLVLMLATLARLETLALVGCALAALVGLWAVRRCASADVAGRLLGRDRARRLAQIPAAPRRAWLLALAFAALPIMLAHDWPLTGDPFYWVLVSQDYSRSYPATVRTPLVLAHALVRRYEHQVGAVRPRCHRRPGRLWGALRGRPHHLIVAVGLIGWGQAWPPSCCCSPPVAPTCRRGISRPSMWRSSSQPRSVSGSSSPGCWDERLPDASGRPGGPRSPSPSGWQRRSPPSRSRGHCWPRSRPPPWTSATLDRDADLSLPAVRAALDQIPHARDYPPGGADWETGHAPPAVILVPGLARPRLGARPRAPALQRRRSWVRRPSCRGRRSWAAPSSCCTIAAAIFRRTVTRSWRSIRPRRSAGMSCSRRSSPSPRPATGCSRSSARVRRWRPATRRRREAPFHRGGRARPGTQWWQAPGAPSESAVRKLLPQPHAETALGLLTVKPAPISVST